MSCNPEDLTVTAPIYFLARSPKYTTIKPYTLRYRPANGFPQTNVERVLHEVEIRDMRTHPELAYEQCGFTMAEMKGCSGMRHEDYDDVGMVEGTHQKEVVDVVMGALGAREVVVCDYVVFSSSRSYSWGFFWILDFGFGERE
jgi:hypothetical protein